MRSLKAVSSLSFRVMFAKRLVRCLLWLPVCGSWPASATAGESTEAGAVASSEEAIFTEVRAILEAHCVSCHGPAKQESQFRMDRHDDFLRGGDYGPAVDLQAPGESWLWKAVRPDFEDLQMPPHRPPLAAGQIATLGRWIERGAPWPAGVVLQPRTPLSESDRHWWSFQPLAEVPPPQLLDDDWSLNEIDRFVFARLKSAGLRPAGMADRRTLIRRLYLDLWGLPPSPEQVAQFVNDPRTDAYDRLVDQLLDDQRYGQRFARLWLDLVRYAESDGFKADVYRPHAWRYRDYVIRALNQDKPYDRFLQEQLAGDELFPNDLDARVATGYLRLWPLEDNQKDVRRQWDLVLNDVTEVTSEVVMGMGIRCARCHDHKYDPLPQRDYFRLQAFFAAMLPRDDLQIVDEQEQQALLSWEQATRDVRLAMRDADAARLASRYKKTIEAFPAYMQTIYRQSPDSWPPLFHQYAYLAEPQIDKQTDVAVTQVSKPAAAPSRDPAVLAWEALQGKLLGYQSLKPASLVPVPCVTDVGTKAPPTYIGSLSEDLAEVTRSDPPIEPGFLSVLDPSDADVEYLPQLNSTGRRATLARWLTSADHPLTTRVIVNRIWQTHFHTGLVATANDFGRQGTLPTHPDLLDWLARRLVQDGWSLKKLHRRIVTSATYRQQSRPAMPAPGEVDATADGGVPPTADRLTELLAHYPVRRLDAEQVRDAMLLVSGELDLRDGGPSVAGDVPRRGIYVRQVRNTPDELLNRFDGPDMFNSCSRRFVTTTPIQSLLLWNSPWALDRAEAFAGRVVRETNARFDRGGAAVAVRGEHGSGRVLTAAAQISAEIGQQPPSGRPAEVAPAVDLARFDDYVSHAYRLALSREPQEAELARVRQFVGSAASSRDAAMLRLVDLCHVLLCSNEFAFVD